MPGLPLQARGSRAQRPAPPRQSSSNDPELPPSPALPLSSCAEPAGGLPLRPSLSPLRLGSRRSLGDSLLDPIRTVKYCTGTGAIATRSPVRGHRPVSADAVKKKRSPPLIRIVDFGTRTRTLPVSAGLISPLPLLGSQPETLSLSCQP